MKSGKVYLVGAGPGDPGLLTQKGYLYLSQADVIVYDYLLDEKLLESGLPGAERIYVGKTAGRHAMEQQEINQLLVDKAQEGKSVVRLKGGDPFVFGRGGEEAATLKDNNVPFEIVPGVSSAIAAPAYAGIPVTHRGVASSFAVITGHEDPNKVKSSINWEKLSTGADTLVFLMGVQNLPNIVEQLVEHGRPPETPIALVKDGTRPGQQTVTGTMEDIVVRVKEAKLTSPAVIIVGEVVRLREKLRWFDNRPLFGKRVLVTRSKHQASALSRLLSQHGAQPVEMPLIDIQAVTDTSQLDRAITELDNYNWIIFSSVNGVETFFRRLNSLKLDSRALSNLKVIAVGLTTAGALESRGIVPDYLPGVHTGQGIIDMLSRLNITGQKFLLPRADIADNELSDGISKLGGMVDDIAVYHTVPATGSASQARQILLNGNIDVITFASSSTVDNLMTALNSEPQTVKSAKIACIGPKTAEMAARAGLTVDILAGEPTIPGLVAAIEQYFQEEV